MSYTEIRLNEDRQEYELLIKVFTDDLEKAVSSFHKNNVEIYTEREHKYADSLIISYLNRSLDLSSDVSQIPLTYIGREYKKSEFFMTYLYFTFPASDFNKLNIRSSLFTEVYDNQLNIVTFVYKNRITKYTLSKYDQEVLLFN